MLYSLIPSPVHIEILQYIMPGAHGVILRFYEIWHLLDPKKLWFYIMNESIAARYVQ